MGHSLSLFFVDFKSWDDGPLLVADGHWEAVEETLGNVVRVSVGP